jgi:hypothetical protein
MYQLLRPDSVRKLLQDHRPAREEYRKLLFSLVILEEWLRGTQVGSFAGVRGTVPVSV